MRGKRIVTPELTGLHPLVIIGVGIAFGIIWFVTKGGFAAGQKQASNGQGTSTAQVVAISADTNALKLATASVEAHTVAVIELTSRLDRNNQKLIDVLEDVGEEIKNLNSNLRDANLIRTMGNR